MQGTTLFASGRGICGVRWMLRCIKLFKKTIGDVKFHSDLGPYEISQKNTATNVREIDEIAGKSVYCA